MHDIKFIREHPEAFDAALARRGVAALSAQILALDVQRRGVATQLQEAQNRRNEASKLIGAAMAKGDAGEAERLKAEVAALKESLLALENEDRALTAELHDLLAAHPNLPDPNVPDGADELGNVEVATWGTQIGRAHV